MARYENLFSQPATTTTTAPATRRAGSSTSRYENLYDSPTNQASTTAAPPRTAAAPARPSTAPLSPQASDAIIKQKGRVLPDGRVGLIAPDGSFWEAKPGSPLALRIRALVAPPPVQRTTTTVRPAAGGQAQTTTQVNNAPLPQGFGRQADGTIVKNPTNPVLAAATGLFPLGMVYNALTETNRPYVQAGNLSSDPNAPAYVMQPENPSWLDIFNATGVPGLVRNWREAIGQAPGHTPNTTVGAVTNAVRRGASTMYLGPENPAEAIPRQEEAARMNPPTPAATRMMQNPSIGQVLTRPVEDLQIIAETMASFGPAELASALLGPGRHAVMPIYLGLQSGQQQYLDTIAQQAKVLQQQNPNMPTAQAVQTVLDQPGVRDEAERRGVTRGLIMGAVALATQGIGNVAARAIGPRAVETAENMTAGQLRNAGLRQGAATVANNALQVGGFMGGEAGYQLATEGRITDPAAIGRTGLSLFPLLLPGLARELAGAGGTYAAGMRPEAPRPAESSRQPIPSPSLESSPVGAPTRPETHIARLFPDAVASGEKPLDITLSESPVAENATTQRQWKPGNVEWAQRELSEQHDIPDADLTTVAGYLDTRQQLVEDWRNSGHPDPEGAADDFLRRHAPERIGEIGSMIVRGEELVREGANPRPPSADTVARLEMTPEEVRLATERLNNAQGSAPTTRVRLANGKTGVLLDERPGQPTMKVQLDSGETRYIPRRNVEVVDAETVRSDAGQVRQVDELRQGTGKSGADLQRGTEAQAVNAEAVQAAQEGVREPWQTPLNDYMVRRPLPEQPRIPEEGYYSAVVTDDGGIYVSKNGHELHQHIIEKYGIPPERVVDGGFVQDGVYTSAGPGYDAPRIAEQARSKERVQHMISVINAKNEGKPVPPEVLADYPDLAPQPKPEAEAKPVEIPAYSNVARFDRNNLRYEAEGRYNDLLDAQDSGATTVKIGKKTLPIDEAIQQTEATLGPVKSAEIRRGRAGEWQPGDVPDVEDPFAEANTNLSNAFRELDNARGQVEELGAKLGEPKGIETRLTDEGKAALARLRNRQPARGAAGKLPEGEGASERLAQDLKDLYTVGRDLYHSGVKDVRTWSKEMIAAFGDWIEEHLPTIWKGIADNEKRTRTDLATPKEGTLRENRPNETLTAGNVNLDRINAPDEVKQFLIDYAMNPDVAAKAKKATRGVRTFADTETAAEKIFFTDADLKKTGKAYNAEEVTALRKLHLKAKGELEEAQARYDADDSSVNKLDLLDKMAKYQVVYLATRGATAEAGRALGIHRLIVEAGKTNRQKALETLTEELGGERVTKKMLDELAKIPEGDVIALHNFMAKYAPVQEHWLHPFQINNLLSNPIGRVRDLTFTYAHGWIRNLIHEPVEALIRVSMRARGGAGRESLAELRSVKMRAAGFIAGHARGAREFLNVMASGVSETQAKKMEQAHQELPGGVWTNWPSRLAGAVDWITRGPAEMSELYVQADRIARGEGKRGQALTDRIMELVDSPTEEMLKAAEEYGNLVTMTGADTVVNAMDSLRNLSVGKSGLKPIKFILPFMRFSYNSIKMAANHTPIGYLKLLYPGETQAARARITAEATIGTTVLASLLPYALAGNITAASPPNEKERQIFYASGKRPYSVKIGKKWVPYNNFSGGMNIVLALLSGFAEGYKRGEAEVDQTAVVQAGATAGRALLDQSSLTAFRDFNNAINSPEQYADNFIARWASGMSPYVGLQGTIARTRDPYVREVTGLGQKTLKMAFPMTSVLFPKRVDPLGRPIVSPASTGFNALSPLPMTSSVQNDPVYRELAKQNIFPGTIRRELTKDGEKIVLTPAERRDYQRFVGEAIYQAVKEEIANPSYQDSTNKAEELQEVIDDTRRNAQVAWKTDHNYQSSAGRGRSARSVRPRRTTR